MRLSLFVIGITWLQPAVVHAEDASAIIAQGDAAYAKRDDVPQAAMAIEVYQRAAAVDPARSVECDWKASRSAWWLGEHAQTRAERMEHFQKGMDFAKKAVALNPECVEAHFWLGANEGSYGEARGILKSLFMVKPVRQEMAEVIRLNDRYLNGGAYRVLGAVDYKVPGFAGGSKKRAKEQLEKALSMDPSDPFTRYYLAEYYTVTGDKAKAASELQTLRTLQVPPDSQPELRMLQRKADRELK